MKKIVKTEYKTNGGAAMMILVFFFVFISLTILVGIVTPVVREFKIVSDNFKSKQSYFLAESGIEDVVYRIKNNLLFDTNENLILGDSSATTTITDISSGLKEIISLGDTNFSQRKVSTTISTGIGVSFSYGILTGNGGFIMDNNSKVIGSVYSNGPITGSGFITGSATSANLSSLISDQSNGSGDPSYSISFGKTSSTQDFAQSFKTSTTDVINMVQLYIKKIGKPSNLTVRITSDSNGEPSTNTLTSGSLSASLISDNYGWVDIPFSSNPELTANTTYWIVVDYGSTSDSKYYKIGANVDYTNGIGKIGKYEGSWNNTSPSGLDGYFNLYLGGATGLIDGITIGENGIGSVYAHTVNNSIIADTNYCKVGIGNNKSCNTSRDDPVQIAMPISDQNILDWKDQAAIGGTITGNYSLSSDTTLGPKKITGDLIVSDGNTLTVSGTIWVQGNLVVDNNGIIKLSSGYGSSEGVIVADGTITLGNNVIFEGSGATGSYVMALSTSSSSSAISLSNNSGAVTLYAANGTINVANNGTAKSLTGHYIHLSNNAIITYDSGLANTNFVSGPSGSWSIDSWKEVE